MMEADDFKEDDNFKEDSAMVLKIIPADTFYIHLVKSNTIV